MSTKDKVLKIGLPIFLVVIIAVVALILLIPKSKNETLTITANDLELSVGQTKKLEYKVEGAAAIVNYKLDDPKIVKANGFNVTGVKEGRTEVTIIAKNGVKIAQCSCNIFVMDAENSNPIVEPGKNEDENPKADITNPSETNPNENPETPTVDPETPNEEKVFELVTQMNCTFENGTLFVKANKSCYFKLKTIDESPKEYILKTTTGVSVVEDKSLGMGMWKMTATQNGQLKIYDGKQLLGIVEIVLE